jgi:hypothetical protein
VTLDSGTIWFTINASWNGTEWSKDVLGQMSSGYMFTVDGFNFFTQPGGTATWALYDWATQTSLGPTGQITSPGQITAVFCAEFQATATTGYYGGCINFPKAFPYTPSSFTWTPTYTSGITGGPVVAVQLPFGVGWYVTYSGAGDKYHGGYVTIS